MIKNKIVFLYNKYKNGLEMCFSLFMAFVVVSLMAVACSHRSTQQNDVPKLINNMTDLDKKVYNQMEDLDKVLFENCLKNWNTNICFHEYSERKNQKPVVVDKSGIDLKSAVIGGAAGYLLAPKSK